MNKLLYYKMVTAALASLAGAHSADLGPDSDGSHETRLVRQFSGLVRQFADPEALKAVALACVSAVQPDPVQAGILLGIAGHTCLGSEPCRSARQLAADACLHHPSPGASGSEALLQAPASHTMTERVLATQRTAGEPESEPPTHRDAHQG